MANNDVNFNFSDELAEFRKMIAEYKSTVEANKDIINMYNEGIRVFGKTSKEIADKLAENPNLKTYYDDIVNKINEIKNIRKKALEKLSEKVDKNNKKRSDNNKVPLSAITKYYNLQKRITKLTEQANLLANSTRPGDIEAYAKMRKEIADNNIELSEMQNRHKYIENAVKSCSKELEDYDKSLGIAQKKAEELGISIEEARKQTKLTADEQEEYNRLLDRSNDRWKYVAKTLGKAWGLTKQAVQETWKYENAAYKTGKAMGMTFQDTKSYYHFMVRNASKLITSLNMPIEDILEFQNKFSEATGRSINLTERQMKMYGSMSKLLGEDTAIGLVEELDKIGAGLSVAAEQAYKSFNDAAKQGLNARKTSAAFVKNLQTAHNFTFKRGVDGVRQMTMLSERLKFNLESVANAAEQMQTVEGSISTAANIQKLGGSFAMNFSDPMRLMYESMNDFEGLTQRIVDTVQGKATFNRQTGEMEMGALDRRFLQEYAKALGMSFEDVFQMATQQAKYKDMESSFQGGLSEEQKTAIGNRAMYNKETGQYEVTYYDAHGDQQTKALKDIDALTANAIMMGNDTEEAILTKTGDILKSTTAIEKLIGSARAYSTGEEIFTASKDILKNGLAQIGEDVNKLLKWGLTKFNDTAADILSSEYGKEASYIGAIGYLAAAGFGGYAATRLGKKWKNKYNERREKKLKRKARENTENTKNKAHRKAVEERAKKIYGNINRQKWKRRGKIGGGIIGGLLAAGTLLTMLTSSQNGEEAQDIIARNEANNNNFSDYNTDIQSEMTEMEKQTALLQKIADNTNGDLPNTQSLAPNQLNKGDIEERRANILNRSDEVAYNGSIIANSIPRKWVSPNVGKALPKIGSVLAIGSAVLGTASAYHYGNAIESDLNDAYASGELSKKDYIKERVKNSQRRASEIGSSIGTSVGVIGGDISGRALGGAAGTFVAGPAGTVVGQEIGGIFGSTIGAYLGKYLGGITGKLFSEDAYDVSKELSQSSRVNAYDYETSKFGKKALNSNNIALTAAQAQIKSSDTISSIYELLVEKLGTDDFKDELERKTRYDTGQKNYSWTDPFGNDKYNSSWWSGVKDFFSFENGGIVKANYGLASVPGTSFQGDKISAMVNSKEMILNTRQQLALFRFIDNLSSIQPNIPNDIKLKEDSLKNIYNKSQIIKPYSDYSSPTYIRKVENNTNNNGNLNSIQPNKANNINLNVNGTIKLDLGGNSRNIDFNQLLNDATFKRELVNIIMNQMSKNANGGRVDNNNAQMRQNTLF